MSAVSVCSLSLTEGEEMKRHVALVNLGLAFVLLFGAAFSCGQNNNRSRSTSTRDDQTEPATRSNTERPLRPTGDLSDLAGGWLVVSQTTKGEQEDPSNPILGCIAFSGSGKWNYGHNGGSAEGGTYRVSGSRLVMTGDDGAVWGDYRLTARTSQDLYLESGDEVMHVRHKDSIGCG